ncbi:MAG: phage tail tape measure protein [Pseudomonadota bacterium]|nr:phage tail tape measure protein [Pseudomonadota bacterium]
MVDMGAKLSVGLTAPIAAFGIAAVRVAGDFEQSMNRVAAVSGATGNELEQLSNIAKEMGRTTQFTASDAADALGFLAMAGFDAKESMEALPGTLQLAASAQMDLAESADIVSNVLSGYGMEVSDLARVNDVLVKAFTASNTNLQQLGEAMTYAGPVAAAAGVQFEEATAALGLMGNAGIQASMAGTSLRGAISRILAPTKKVSGIMAELGLKFTDAQGKLVPLVDIITQLGPHADDAGLFMELFGQRAGPAMAALVSQGAGALTDLTTDLQNAGGTAKRIADVQMEGLNGAMKRLQSAFEGLQIAIAESGLLDIVGNLVTRLSDLIQRMSEVSPTALRVGTAIAAIAAAAGPVLLVMGTLISSASTIVAAFATVGPALAGALSVSAITAFGAALAPILPIIAAVGAAALVIYQNWDKVSAQLDGLRETFNATLGPALANLIETLKGSLSELWDGPLGSALSIAGEALGAIGAIFLRVFGETAIRSISALINVITGMVRLIDGVVTSVGHILKGDFAGAFETAKNSIIGTLRALFDAVENIIGAKLDAVWSRTIAGIEKVDRAFFKLYDAVVGHSYIPDMVDGIADQMARLDKEMVDPADRAANKVGDRFEALATKVQDLMGRLFPEVAERERAQSDWDTIGNAQAAGMLSSDQAEAARGRLIAPPLDLTHATDVVGISGETMTAIEAHNESIAASFDKMATSVSQSLRSLANGIKNGDFLNIIGSVAGLLGGIIGGGTGGTLSKIGTILGGGFPGFATGTPHAPRGMAWVGERGPELVNFRGGERVYNNADSKAMMGGRSVMLRVDPSPYFDVTVDGRAANVAAPMANRAAVAGSTGAQVALARKGSRTIP